VVTTLRDANVRHWNVCAVDHQFPSEDLAAGHVRVNGEDGVGAITLDEVVQQGHR
jgi:hypothetical protein